MRPKHFCKLRRRITQKMYLNFMANSFVVKRKNREMRPELLYKLCNRRIPKIRLNFYMLWPENGFNRENMSLTSLKKYLNWVLWNLSQWRKLRPKMQVPIFKIFVGWRPKKMPKVPFFFPLRGNTAANTYWMDFFLETCSFLNNCFYVF